MTEWITRDVLTLGVAGICLLHFFMKMAVRHTYKRLLKEVSDIGHVKHRFLKMLCTKFDTSYQLRVGVPNVSLFVEKYLRHYRLFGIYLRTWENLTGFYVILVMAASMSLSIGAMLGERSSFMVFYPLLAGVVGTGVLVLVDYLGNTGVLWTMLVVDITDYLENFCKPRLENETFHPMEVEHYRRQYFEDEKEDAGKVVALMPKERETGVESELVFTPEEEDVIREVIEEYLG
jgi:hypothetical protein